MPFVENSNLPFPNTVIICNRSCFCVVLLVKLDLINMHSLGYQLILLLCSRLMEGGGGGSTAISDVV